MQKRYYEFDFIRFIAVLLVIFGHYLCHFHNYMSYGERFLKIHGIGVGMFFFISGFLITLSLEKLTDIQFVIHRYLRITPALFIVVCILSLFYGGFSFWKILYTLFFVGDLVGDYNICGIDTWTLSTEFRFYILILIVFGIFLKRDFNNKGKLITCFLLSYILIILFISIALFFSATKIFSGPVWNIYCITYLFFGVIFFFYKQGKLNKYEMLLLVIVNCAILFTIKYSLYKQSFIELIKDEYLLGSVISLSIIKVKNFIPNLKIVSFGAYISYSVYLIHHPLIFRYGILGIIETVFLAIILSLVIEYPIIKLSKTIK